MKKTFLLTPILVAIVSGCGGMQETFRALEENREAIDCSTEAILENQRAVQEANRSIAENRRQLDAINKSLKKASES